MFGWCMCLLRNFIDNFIDFLLALGGESLIVGDFNNLLFDRPNGPHSLLLSGFLCGNSLLQYNGVRNFRGGGGK